MAVTPIRIEELLFVGTHGHVVAIEQKSGAEVWRTSLPKTGYSVVTLLFEEGRLLAASGGHCFALDPATGQIAWHNPLSGLGNGVACLATTRTPANAGADPLPQIQAAHDAAAAAAGGHVVVPH
jgi:outer membrane protein assembly factor BamB